MSDLKGQLIGATKYTLIFKTCSQILSVLATILLVRLLSEHDYGVYNIFYSLISLFGLFASFGLVNTLQRYIPEYYTKKEFLVAHRLYRIVSNIRLLSNVMILGVILLLWNYLAPLLKIAEYKNYFFLFSVILLLHFQWGLTETCLSSYFQHKYSQAMAALFATLKFLGYGLVILTYNNLWAVFIVELIAYLILLSGLQIAYWNKIPIQLGQLNGIDRVEKKRLFRYAFFYNFNDAGSSILAPDFDNFLIAMYLNPVAVGAYAFCQRITKMLQHVFPVTYLIDVIRPAFFTVGIDSGQTRVTHMYQFLIKITYVVTIPLFVGLLFLGQDIIMLFFGGKFAEYSFVLSVVFFFTMLNAFQTPVGFAAMLREKADIILYSKIFAFYNIIADIILIPLIGIWGAVLATGTAILGKNLFIWYFVRREASFAGLGIFFSRLVFFWSVTGALLWRANNLIELSIVGHFLLGSLLIAISFILQFQLRLFTLNEAGILRKVFSKYKGMGPILKLLRVETA